jgi:hypothetical protein
LNALGQSTYEGMHFLASLIERNQGWHPGMQPAEPLRYRTARGAAYLDNDRKLCPIYLAQADGHLFQVAQRL